MIDEKQFEKLSPVEKKKYPFATAIGNKDYVAATFYFKTKKEQLAADKNNDMPVGKDWTEEERLKAKKRTWPNYF